MANTKSGEPIEIEIHLDASERFKRAATVVGKSPLLEAIAGRSRIKSPLDSAAILTTITKSTHRAV
jgi:hypothetical protein